MRLQRRQGRGGSALLAAAGTRGLSLMPAPKRLVDRETRLRAGYVEEGLYGDMNVYFYWEPHYDVAREVFLRDFVIEWADGRRKEYHHGFEEAVKRLDEIEREYIIKAMARALIGPNNKGD
jgi:hypothetical protein